MKSLILVSLFLSLGAMASENCTLNVKKYLVEPDCNRNTDIKESVLQTNTVQECYEKALDLADRIQPVRQYNGGIDAGFCKTYVGKITQYNYISWEFNDGYIDNSDGTVNAFTPRDSIEVELGDNTYDINGYKLH